VSTIAAGIMSRSFGRLASATAFIDQKERKNGASHITESIKKF
jgi:hypothetical protein